ncbi:unnamed protein product, partial [marine sediment metagenome]
MALTLGTIDVKLDTASMGVDYHEQSYSMEFQVRSDVATTVVLVSQWLVDNLPWSLAYWGGPYAFISTYSLVADPKND